MSTNINIDTSSNSSKFKILIIILILGLLGLAYYGKKYKEKFKAQKELAQNLSESINHLNDTVKTYQIKWENGKKTYAAKVEAIQVEKSNFEKLYKDEVIKAKKLGVKLNDINSVSQIQTETSGTQYVPVYVDSLKQLTTSYKDSFTYISCIIPRTGKSKIDYSIRDSLFIVDIYKRHKLLFGLIKWKSRQNRMIVTSMNPKTKILGFTVHKVIQK